MKKIIFLISLLFISLISPILSHTEINTNNIQIYIEENTTKEDIPLNTAEIVVYIKFDQIVDILAIGNEGEFQAEFSEEEMAIVGEYITSNIEISSDNRNCEISFNGRSRSDEINGLAGGDNSVPLVLGLNCPEDLGYIVFKNTLFVKPDVHQQNFLSVLDGEKELVFGAIHTEIIDHIEFNLRGEDPPAREEDSKDTEEGKIEMTYLTIAFMSFLIGIAVTAVTVRLVDKFLRKKLTETKKSKPKKPAKRKKKSA